MTIVICSITVISFLMMIAFAVALKLSIEEINDEKAFINFLFLLQSLVIFFLCVMLLSGDYNPEFTSLKKPVEKIERIFK